MTQFIFLEDKKGAHNGIDAVEHKKGDIVDEGDLSEYLKNAWIEQGALSEVKDCGENCDECDEVGCANHPDFETGEDEEDETDEDEQNEQGDETSEEDETDEIPANVETIIVGGVEFPIDTVGEKGETDAENIGEVGEDEGTSTDEDGEDAPQKEETDEDGEDAGQVDEEDENPLVKEAQEIINAEAKTPESIARLKEIGIALDVDNIEKCSNADTIIKKVQKALDDLAEEGTAE